MYPQSVPRSDHKPRARSRTLSAAAWLIAAGALAWTLAVWMPLALAHTASRGEIGDWAWIIDLCASLASQSVPPLACAALVAAALRRWPPALLTAAACAAVAALPLSEPRLPRATTTGPTLRVLTYNAKTGSGHLDAKAELVRSANADALVLLEPPLDWVHLYLAGGGGLDNYHTGWRPTGAWSGCPLLLSKHPVDEHSIALAPLRRKLWDHFYRLEILRTPAGPVALIQAHARSPRRPARWRTGLEQLLLLADAVKELQERTGLPVIVAGDFNSPPTGLRARAFALRSGLIRAKPMAIATGTFPAWLPSWAGVAIDDLYASPGITLVSWKVTGSAGSDHRAVIVELRLPQGASGSEP